MAGQSGGNRQRRSEAKGGNTGSRKMTLVTPKEILYMSPVSHDSFLGLFAARFLMAGATGGAIVTHQKTCLLGCGRKLSGKDKRRKENPNSTGGVERVRSTSANHRLYQERYSLISDWCPCL